MSRSVMHRSQGRSAASRRTGWLATVRVIHGLEHLTECNVKELHVDLPVPIRLHLAVGAQEGDRARDGWCKCKEIGGRLLLSLAPAVAIAELYSVGFSTNGYSLV
jgi:hypothetical protein